MKKMVDDLLLILAKETEIYKEASKIAEEKKQVIIDGKLKDLEVMTGREQALVASLIKLENMRGSVLDDLIRSVKAEHVDSINDLLQYLDAPYRQKIEKVKSELSQEVFKLKDRNELNGKLLEQSLDLIHLNMELMSSLEADGRYTQNASDTKAKSKNSLFDAKV
jgi:flagellar biosynthesis/type III secretory pathway chaperone